MLSGLAMLVLVVSSAPPAEGFLFGLLRGFFQPFPLLNIPTYAQRTAVGGIYINAFPFTTPPAGETCSSLCDKKAARTFVDAHQLLAA